MNFKGYCDRKRTHFTRLYPRKGLLWWDFAWPPLSVKVKVGRVLSPSHTHMQKFNVVTLSNWGYGKGMTRGINNNHVYRVWHILYCFWLLFGFACYLFRCHFVELLLLLLFFFECVCHACGGSHIYCFGGHKSKHFLRSVKPNGFMIIGNWRKEGDIREASQTSEFNCVL